MTGMPTPPSRVIELSQVTKVYGEGEGEVRALRGIVGIRADNGPREACAFAGAPGISAPVGVKRSAAFGTSVAP